MRRFADRHFETIERWSSLAGAFGMGALILPAYLPGTDYKLVAAGLIVGMAITKLYLIDWFKYQKIENKTMQPPAVGGSEPFDATR